MQVLVYKQSSYYSIIHWGIYPSPNQKQLQKFLLTQVIAGLFALQAIRFSNFLLISLK